jgi:hypothetical protein
MKNLWNNLYYDIIVNDKTVSFGDVQQMYELDKKSSLRLCPKLIDGHFDLEPFKKMKVRLAAQIFRHSVAATLKTHARFKQLEQTVLGTAQFVEEIDQLFDILSSRTRHSKHQWKKPLTANSTDQFKVMDKAVAWIASWKFQHIKSGKEKQTLPFHQGFVLTVRAIRLATTYLPSQQSFRYVLTSRFNQDVMENRFSCIRQKRLNNDSQRVGSTITIKFIEWQQQHTVETLLNMNKRYVKIL